MPNPPPVSCKRCGQLGHCKWRCQTDQDQLKQDKPEKKASARFHASFDAITAKNKGIRRRTALIAHTKEVVPMVTSQKIVLDSGIVSRMATL
ncbi:hypothetical protein FALBO_1068 [Fusarium albosuccineum]|uniref:Uncharacterized protein n=1 Tax=Fusarium albosuccineum TaxID=1237068 RepID=A0A8H4LNY3_9HYPO|nr:hypothetical protein FALBO_1068 [Fusarium albosuccineum]